jgi:hypothetical protein
MVSRARLLARASYFRVSLKVFPVGLLTKCSLVQTGQVTASYSDFLSCVGASSSSQCWTSSRSVITHDALSQLAHITAPTQITFSRHDTADTLKNGIVGSVRLMERRRLPLLLPGRTVSGSG